MKSLSIARTGSDTTRPLVNNHPRTATPSARHTLALAAALCAAPAAWSQATAAAPAAQPPGVTLAAAPTERVVVTGNPLGGDELAQPASVLSGDRLTLRRAGTLGETLDGLPGVASTWFGPNASRPTIRGLDGDRVRLLDNAGAAIDASNLSFDHAVAIDPLVIERVEVLRGPASLLYGGNATGGVVNTIDNRIPQTALDGVGGRAELRFGGAASERAGSALVEGGQGGLNWHVDAFDRKTSDLRVPRFTPVEDGEPLAPSSHVRNSAAQSQGGAVGGSWADSDGYVGASLDSYRSDYGVTAEPDVLIRMQRERLALALERRLDGPFTNLSVRFGDTRYRHEEVEGTGEVGTTFKSTGQDLRVELRHAAVAGVQGVIGLQAESMRFSALGEEAFVPGTRTRSAALFALEETKLGPLTVSAGLRAEQTTVRSDGDAPDAEAPKFGDAMSRRFSPFSASLSALWPVGGGWSLSGVVGSTERAPAYYELYANGVHVATGAYERGDTSLGLEKSVHADLGLAWKAGADSFKANLFTMRFDRFISLEASGADIAVTGEDGAPEAVPEYVFRAVPARLWGVEIEGRKRLLDGAWQVDASAGLDLTRGVDRQTGQALPRIAPMRVSLGLEAAQGPWRMGAGVKRASAQERVPANDEPTAGYTLLNLWLTRETKLGPADALWFLKLENLGDELAYSAGSIATIRGLSPLPGRSASAGLRVSF
ncbi:MAG TPA: TonB-dependent receptor [Ideonella sp.]|nr:TonB-dependent receptor [Ideonella sp.]